MKASHLDGGAYLVPTQLLGGIIAAAVWNMKGFTLSFPAWEETRGSLQKRRAQQVSSTRERDLPVTTVLIRHISGQPVSSWWGGWGCSLWGCLQTGVGAFFPFLVLCIGSVQTRKKRRYRGKSTTSIWKLQVTRLYSFDFCGNRERKKLQK